MKRSLRLLILFITGASIYMLSSCDDKEEPRPTFPLAAEIFYSASDFKVAFTAVTHSAVSWSWDFGDGNTSTEQAPVHIYNESDDYLVKLTATDRDGNSVTKEVEIGVALTPYTLLVGNPNAEGYKGKTWKLSSDHEPLKDYFANADKDLSVVEGTPSPLPTGIFGQLGFGDAYTDEFTFHHDGSYTHDVKADGASFGGAVYQVVLNGGADIIKLNTEFGLAIAKYTPEDDATFMLEESEDFEVETVYGKLTFKNAITLDFSGNEFIGFRDFQRKVVVRSISKTRMQLILFMAAGQTPETIGINTHALILTFEAVN